MADHQHRHPVAGTIMPPRLSLRRLAPAAGLALAGCVFVPVQRDDYDARCDQVRHHLDMEPVQIADFRHCVGNTPCEGFAVAALATATVSAVVSGSIVVIGNTVYWLERQAGCSAPPAAPIPPAPAADAPA